MKTLLKIIFLSLILNACWSSKFKTKDYTYFDENNVEIDKKIYRKKKQTGGLLGFQLDSTKFKLTAREKRGTLSNMSKFVETLKTGLNITLDNNKPIAIIFYPGEDHCNSVASMRIDYMKAWYNQLEEGLQQVAQTKPLYIYKDSKGLENYDGLLEWKQDPNQFIKNLFFNHHYPCNSFVVISSKGGYISYFGEFPKEFLWEAAQILN